MIAASFGKVVLERRGPMFFLRYLRALLRHYEEGFWLVVLFVLTSLPGLREVSRILGVVRFAERRAASASGGRPLLAARCGWRERGRAARV